jgi:protein phosphatase
MADDTVPYDPNAIGHLARSTFGGRTIVGRVRARNEDAYEIDERLELAVVCDGIGGHERGEVASALAVRTIIDHVAAAKPPQDQLAAADLLEEAIRHADAAVFTAGGGRLVRRRMGTTAVVLWLVAEHALVAHVGDSRCYLLRCGSFRCLTTDHTLLAESRRQSLVIEHDDDTERRLARMLTRSIGQGRGCIADVSAYPLISGDRFLLCSDGLTGMLDDDEIASILASSRTPELAALGLTVAADARGGADNITAVVMAWEHPVSRPIARDN